MSHTPGEWEKERIGHDIVIAQVNNDHVIAYIPTLAENSEDNANFIVRACNAYDELLETLENILDKYERKMKLIETCDLDDGEINIIQKAHNIIYKTKGE